MQKEIDMVLINGGTLNNPANENQKSDFEGRQHQSTVNAFWIGKEQVVQNEFELVMNEPPIWFGFSGLGQWKIADWYCAVEYCNRLSRLEQLTPVYRINGENVGWDLNADGYRLLTEAEWEYALIAASNIININKDLAEWCCNYPSHSDHMVETGQLVGGTSGFLDKCQSKSSSINKRPLGFRVARNA